MKLKTFRIIVLILGLIMAAVGFALPVIAFDSSGAAGGIIGGAGGPTYEMLMFNLWDGLPFVLVLLGIPLALTGLVCLAFPKAVDKHCHIPTFLSAIGLSAVGGVGVVCFLEWFTIAALSSPKRYPVAYPLSIAVGSSAFLIFCALLAVYYLQRRKAPSVLGVILDVFTSIMYLPGCFWAVAYLAAILR